MPNWCSTAYAIEGNATELKNLYELMTELQERQKPSVQNGFGTTWLGCLVEALGESWEKIYCRGTWDNLNFNGEVLTFNTETAWSPCNEMFDMVCENIPHCDISISRKSLACVSIGRTIMRVNTFQTNTMLMYVLRRKNTIPSIFKI